MTLASWNDSEFAGGSIEAGSFAIEGSTTGTEPFSSTTVENPHSLTFTVEGNLYPGATTYSLFSVRAQEGSLGGSVQVLADDTNTEGLGAHLTYGVREVAGTTCDASTFADAGETANVVAPGSALSEGAPTENVQTIDADASSTVNYCLELTLPEDASTDAQGLAATPRWEFLGTSVSE